jgi:hypothetical protein
MTENESAGQQFNLPDLLEKLKLQNAAEDVRMGKTLAVFDAVSKLTGAKQVGTSLRLLSDQAFIQVWPDDKTHTLADAIAIVDKCAGQIITCNHWNNGNVSTQPDEINSCKTEPAIVNGTHAIEILVSGGKDCGPDIFVKFWVRLADVFCEIECPVSNLGHLVPGVSGKWPSEPPAYRGSYYFADIHNFKTRASSIPHI